MSSSATHWTIRIAIAAVAFTAGFLIRETPAAYSPLDDVVITQEKDLMKVRPARSNTAVAIYSAADPEDGASQDDTDLDGVRDGATFVIGRLATRLGGQAIPCMPKDGGTDHLPGCTPVLPPKFTFCVGGQDDGPQVCGEFETVQVEPPFDPPIASNVPSN